MSIAEDEIFQGMPKFMQEELRKDNENKTFTLYFKENKSLFSLDVNLNNSEEKNYYKEIDSTYSLRAFQNETFGKLVLKEDRDLDWIISYEDKKEINDLICYKASFSNKVQRGDQFFNYVIIAWFCPEIPIPIGPLGYGGLPGLILELQNGMDLYGATEIKFEKIKKEIIKPNQGKLIAYQDFEKMIEEYYSKD